MILIAPLHADESGDAQRQQRVAERRKQVQVIVHRGVSTLARENTLRAYRLTFELGADGNEIDIRATRDGVLVCFHDDMLDHHLEAFGDVSDYDWEQLKLLRFRVSSTSADEHIPTLEQVFELHRSNAGLMHLDVKRPGLEQPIAELLERMDLWDHVVAINAETAPALAQHPRYRPGQYKGSLYQDRAEWFPEAITAMMTRPGDMVIVDDPRGVLVELGRDLGEITPPQPFAADENHVRDRGIQGNESEVLSALEGLVEDWDVVPHSSAERKAKAERIVACAEAAEAVGRQRLQSKAILDLLARRVIDRSVHPEWMYHGLDGASALRALAVVDEGRFVELARASLWRVDPQLAAVADPRWTTPHSWVDFRTKAIVFSLVEQHRITAATALCRDYLALSDQSAREIGPPQFEAAARALLAIEAKEATAIELLRHRRQDVRGTAIVMCLRATDSENASWARAALESAAPHALRY